MAAYCAVPRLLTRLPARGIDVRALADDLAGGRTAGDDGLSAGGAHRRAGPRSAAAAAAGPLDLRASRGRRRRPARPGPGDGHRRDHPDPAGARARPGAGHPVRHGDGDPVACRKPGAAQYLPGRRRAVAAGRTALATAWRSWPRCEAARGSFDAAHAAIARRCGPVMGKRQIEESVAHAAADIPAFYAARVPEPCTSMALVVLSRRLQGHRDAARGAAAGHREGRRPAGEDCAPGWPPGRNRAASGWPPWSASTTPSPANRRPHDVIAPPGGRSGSRPLRPGPQGPGQVAGRVRPQGPGRGHRRRVRRGRGPRPRPPADLGRPGRRGRHQLEPDPRRGRPPDVSVHLVIDLMHVLELSTGPDAP